jgi:hypothetical protein
MLSAADPVNASKTARYIGAMAAELKRLALTANLPFVAYLLAMVEEEVRAEAESMPAPVEGIVTDMTGGLPRKDAG